MGIRSLTYVLATLLIITTFPHAASAEAPLADAGLDQTVTKGATVHLDATGSRDPDGSIDGYNWNIVDPSGTRVLPDCPTCGQTTFTADTVGTYEVTVTVTDDDGETASDTLYVHVEPGEPPSLVVTGPSKLQTGQTGTYVAEAESGDAALERIVWLVDGNPVDTQSVTGDAAISTLDQQFPTVSTHHVTARIVDADDQTAIRTVTTSVDSPPSNPGTQPFPLPGEGTSGNRGTATVTGPQILTGAEPLRGTYTLSGSHIDSVTWWKNGMKVGDGTQYTTAFSPGDHRLHAAVTYTDGSTDIGRFGDATTRVVADPKPRIAIDDLGGTGGLNIDSTASDDYGNLHRFEIQLYGETILSQETNQLDLQKDDEGLILELTGEGLEVDPGTYEAELVATDGRGQKTRRYETVEVVGPPEVVRSEFVDNGDLDVYHPRIDPERYTARHVLEIELNGVSHDDIFVNYHHTRGLKSVANTDCTPEKHIRKGTLVWASCWASPTVSTVRLDTDVEWGEESSMIHRDTDNLTTTPSDPEIKVRVISGGAGKNAKRWGLWIDAGDSFDPDGTTLDYHWLGKAVPANDKGNIGKLDSFHKSHLMVKDQNEGQAIFRESFLNHINPKISEVRQVSSGPFLPDDEVIFVISSESYELPKNRYRRHIDINTKLSDGDVIDRYDYNGEFAGEVHDWYIENENESRGNFDQIFWTVSIPAEAFLNGRPTFETYHVENREETLETALFPRPEVLERGEPYAIDTEIDTEYVVERPIYRIKSTVYQNVLDEYEGQGYQVIRTEQTGREWTFERRELVSPAEYTTDSAAFETRGERAMFLEMNPDWRSNGSVLTSKEVRTTEYEWRNRLGGIGDYTGETRQQKIRSANYRVERKYRYDYQTTETRTGTRTKTYSYDTTVEYQDTIEECNRYIGCYERTVTRSKSVTRTATRDYEVSYDVEITKSATYWSTGKRDSSHSYTGDSRTILVHPAEYRTQYKFAYEVTTTTQSRKYKASVSRLVEPAKYEWKFYQTTRSPVHAQVLQASGDVRQSGATAVTEWTLRKQTGSELRTYNNYENTSKIRETNVEVAGKIVTPYKDTDTGEIVIERENRSSLQYTASGFEDKDRIIEMLIENWIGGSSQ